MKSKRFKIFSCLLSIVFLLPTVSQAEKNVSSGEPEKKQNSAIPGKKLWAKKFKYPIDKILVSSNGTGIAIFSKPLGFYVLSPTGEILSETIINNSVCVDRCEIKSFIGKDEALYITDTGSTFSSINKYSPESHYSQVSYPFQGHNIESISDIAFSQDYREMYISARDSGINSHTIFSVYNNKNNMPGNYIWQSRKLDSFFAGIFTNRDSSQLVAFLNVDHGLNAYKIDTETGTGAYTHSGISPLNGSQLVQDKEGNIYGPQSYMSSVVRKLNMNSLKAPLWEYDSKQKYPNKGYRWLSLGELDNLYETYNDKIYAINKETGNEMFNVPVPKGERFQSSVVTDPNTGWGYSNYSSGVLGFSPDGNEVISVIKMAGLNNTPAIWNGRLYINTTNEVHVYLLPGQAIQQKNLDGNIIPEADRGKPHRISWEVKNNEGKRDESASGYLDFDGSDPMLLDQYRWPLLVSEAINKQRSMLQAGPKVETDGKNGPGTPVASQYLNWLWLPEARVQGGYHVELSVSKTSDIPVNSEWSLNPDGPESFESHDGDNFQGKTVEFTVTLENGESFSHDFTTTKQDRFAAVQDIATQVNRSLYVGAIRMGEKVSGLSGYEITPLKSQYRNKIWVREVAGNDGRSVASVEYRVR